MQPDPAWAAILALFSSNANWATMLAWIDETPKCSTDSNNVVDFPEELSNWLMLVPVDLAAFNTLNTACGTPSCGKAHSADALPGSLCA